MLPIEISADMPVDPRLKHLRVAAYCRVSTDHTEQDSSIELQVMHFHKRIRDNPNWTEVCFFEERATGLNLHERPEFRKMISQCKKGKIDLILTKSISRFGRNTLDVLRALLELQQRGIDVHFEEENLWLHDRKVQLLLTAYCAFAQDESENMSRNIKWGIKRGFESGTSGYARFTCYGYKRGDDGSLAIAESDARIVRKIFGMRAEGCSIGEISDWLYVNDIPSPRGDERWSRETIRKLLRNEKYVGDVLLQKTFVKNLFSGKQIKNSGELAQYLIQQHHPAIISRKLFEAANRKCEK